MTFARKTKKFQAEAHQTQKVSFSVLLFFSDFCPVTVREQSHMYLFPFPWILL